MYILYEERTHRFLFFSNGGNERREKDKDFLPLLEELFDAVVKY